MMAADLIANRYRIVREIARSNDVVYEALDTTVGRRVAVKELQLPPNLTGQERRDRIERFIREARAAGKLSHPNIVTVYDFGEEAGRHYIVMEYLEGITLRDALQTKGALPVNEAIEIASKVLAGLAHAHSHQVVHRDVKPDNIHLLPDGGVKLADFGIARIMEEASLTGAGQVFGTPSYMSPEQIEGRAVDHRTDIFSMGVVLYEMLAGRKPFQGDNLVSITYAIMHNQPLPLTGVPRAVEEVVFQALNKNPLLRFQSADAMRSALLAAQQVPEAPSWAPGPSRLVTGQPFTPGPLVGGPPPSGSIVVSGAPPVAAPPGSVPPVIGGVPPIAGGTLQQPIPPMQGPVSTAGSPGGAFAGPFANWDPSSPGIGSVPPPVKALNRRSAGMSPGVRAFFVVLGVTVLISGAILGLVVLFLRAYEEQAQNALVARASQLNEEGRRLFQGGDLEGAAGKFDEARKAAPGTDASAIASQNLVQTYNRLGLQAYQRGDAIEAERYWSQALEVDPNNEDAQYNLRVLHGRSGSYVPPAGSSSGLRLPDAGRDNRSASTSLGPREQEARDFLKSGIEAYSRGDRDTARDYWRRALEAAPGTDAALQAQQLLDQTASAPDFGASN
ncbi:MAG: protein kinase domain-containing protein [Chthonomonadales bacterium]